jgi:sentrin-specific protease 1
MHWVCAVIYMQQKRIQFYDSMGDSGRLYLGALFQYIKDEHQDKKGVPLGHQDQWELITCTRDTPRQLNGTMRSFRCFAVPCFLVRLRYVSVVCSLLRHVLTSNPTTLCFLFTPGAGFDCGVFTCMFADFLSKDCPLVFGQSHVTQCRERIALSILNGQAVM